MMYDGAYDTRERGINEYAPAWLVYQRGVDDCDGHAILQCSFLEMNGGDAYMLGMGLPKASGHNVCAVDTNDGIIVLDNMGGIVGPFDSFESAALHYIHTDEWFGMIRASQITEIVTGNVRSALSWIVIWNPPTATP
jgi:predicted transglutaminase-like cysteine proteinase